jgi:hypothetical protein
MLLFDDIYAPAHQVCNAALQIDNWPDTSQLEILY